MKQKNLLFRFEAKIKIKVLTPALSASRFSVAHAVEKVPLLWSCQPYQERDDGFKPETGVLLRTIELSHLLGKFANALNILIVL